MNIFIFDCELYCEACAHKGMELLRAEFPEEMTKEEEKEFQSMLDSAWIENSEPSDHPEHCDCGEDCVNAISAMGETVGCWLENPLTDEGVKYVKDAIKRRDGNCWKLWKEWYADQLRPANKIGLKIFSGD